MESRWCKQGLLLRRLIIASWNQSLSGLATAVQFFAQKTNNLPELCLRHFHH